MSDAVPQTPEVPATPITADAAGAAPGPTSGTTPLGAGAEAASAPAADLPAPEVAASEAAPAVEAPDPLATSLLTETKPPEAPAAEEVKEPPPPVPLPTYEAFNTPDGVKLGDEQVGAFNGLLGEFEQKLGATPEAHAAAQEFGQKLIDLYVAEAQEAQQRYARFQQDNWQRTIDGWVAEFRADPDIGDKRQDTTLQRCGAALQQYGSAVGADKEQALRQVFALTGAGNHPEVVRFINWVADGMVERGRMIAAPPRPVSLATSKSQRLYRNSIPTNGAA